MQNRLLEQQIPRYDSVTGGLKNYMERGVPDYTLCNSDDCHFHAVLEIGICVSGSGICYVDGMEYPYHSGSCQLVLPTIPHCTFSLDSALSVWKWFFVAPKDFVQLGEEPGLTSYYDLLTNHIGVVGVFDEERFPQIADDIVRLCDELNEPQSPTKPVLCRLCIKALLLHLLTASEEKKPYHIQIPTIDERILHVLRTMEDCLENGRQPSVSTLAAQCGFSVSYFRSYFRTLIGVAPKPYMIRQAVRRVQMYLLTTEISIEEIASLTGFNDTSALYRNFEAIHGMSPMQYRQHWKPDGYSLMHDELSGHQATGLGDIILWGKKGE